MGLNQIAKFEGSEKTYIWDSHYELHRFMEVIYVKKKIYPQCGEKLYLKKNNIDDLRNALKKNFMPIMYDFMDPSDFTDLNIIRYKNQDKEFCDWALANLENNRGIYYTFW